MITIILRQVSLMKKIIVQKYGGSSLSTIHKIKKVAQKIVNRLKEREQIVVVVSAMGKETDRLLNLAYQISPSPDKREMDMLISTGEQVSIALLAMAIQQLGNKAISFTARHAGILTDSFIVTEEDFIPSLNISKEIAGKIGINEIYSNCQLAKVSIVGDGITKEAGIASRMFRSLSQAGIYMETINTSRIRISCLINQADLEKAVNVLHEEFKLSRITKEV